MAGDEERPIIQPKASGGISLQVPKLNGTNYITWAIVVEAILDDQELWDVVQPKEGAVINAKKNKTARSFLIQVMDGDILLQISQYKNARDIWTALKARYVGAKRVQNARLLTLKSEFEKLKMAENETVDEFAGKITSMVSNATSLCHVFEHDVLVKKLLDAVPDKLKAFEELYEGESALQIHKVSYFSIDQKVVTKASRMISPVAEVRVGTRAWKRP
ncbi:uncharacterized protein LOC143628684 [Bidens hawaiensis]|uniref:uncharacterized protein LOC143628684 n=1 Tax=Bidens hawaiensis TaxID=980011 RepID=UPI0040493C43